jgi:hypothetical protein
MTNPPFQCRSWTNPPIHHQPDNPSPICQSITNPPFQCQSITDPPIHQQSINPSPIRQSITNPPIHHQSANPMSILYQSINTLLRQINEYDTDQLSNHGYPSPIGGQLCM